MTLRLLDLYCGQGGAALGYHQAGFTVTGVDNQPTNRRYYPYTFICADAITYLLEHGHQYDYIHASPPCQHASRATAAINRDKYPNLIETTRQALQQVGKPYVIENVIGARLHRPLLLCGTMFNLTTTDKNGVPIKLLRHRLFETTTPITQPHCQHQPGWGNHKPGWQRNTQIAGVYDGARRDLRGAKQRQGGYTPQGKQTRAALLGITHPMTLIGLNQAIPPAYTRHIGLQLIETHP